MASLPLRTGISSSTPSVTGWAPCIERELVLLLNNLSYMQDFSLVELNTPPSNFCFLKQEKKLKNPQTRHLCLFPCARFSQIWRKLDPRSVVFPKLITLSLFQWFSCVVFRSLTNLIAGFRTCSFVNLPSNWGPVQWALGERGLLLFEKALCL